MVVVRMCVKTVMREDGVTIQPQITDVDHAIKVRRICVYCLTYLSLFLLWNQTCAPSAYDVLQLLY